VPGRRALYVPGPGSDAVELEASSRGYIVKPPADLRVMSTRGWYVPGPGLAARSFRVVSTSLPWML